jgi:hypothetical protein
MDDRRGIGRFDLRLLSRVKKLWDGEETRELFTRDISSDGAFLVTDDPLPVDTNLNLTLYLLVGQSLKSKITVDGRVIRSEPCGMAVRFEPGYKLVPA